MTANVIRKATPWRVGALQKYYSIDAQVSGMRSGINDANTRLAAVVTDLRQAEREEVALLEFNANTPILRGQQEARDRSHDRLGFIKDEIERLRAVHDQVTKNRDALVARLNSLSPLVDRCAKLLVSLKIISREESKQ